MNEAILRELVEDAQESMGPILAAVASGVAGKFTCPLCSADATWQRRGRNWDAGCTQCHWEAVGMLKASEVRS